MSRPSAASSTRRARATTAVIGVDDEPSRAIRAELDRDGGWRVVPVSSAATAARGVYVEDGALIDDLDGAGRAALDLQARSRPCPARTIGRTRRRPMPPAARARRRLGGRRALDRDLPRPAAPPGADRHHRRRALRQRQQGDQCRRRRARRSPATTMIYWIAGGQPKEGGIDSLAPHFPRIVHAFLIGEAAPAFAKVLDGRVPYTHGGRPCRARSQARATSRPGPRARADAVVLLSPACASFDQFANFEARGDMFRALVDHLPGERRPRSRVGSRRMSASFARTDTSVLGRWWWTIDRWILVGARRADRHRHHPDLRGEPAVGRPHRPRQLSLRQAADVLSADGRADRALACRCCRRAASSASPSRCSSWRWPLTALTLVAGAEIKGARRWLSLAGMSVQPSEFLKPTFAVVTAWLFSLPAPAAALSGQRHRHRRSMSSSRACSSCSPISA